ncbi:MAG: hypothetical protein AAF206_19320, partial [Bacteroidota bacterium]
RLKERQTYTTLKYVWAVLIVLGALGYFFTTDYYRGLMLGIIFVGFTGLMLDSFLHKRMEEFLAAIG